MDTYIIFGGAMLAAVLITIVFFWKAGKSMLQASVTGFFIGLLAGIPVYLTNVLLGDMGIFLNLFLSFFSVLFVGFASFTVWFFRDPERRIPHEEGIIVAPADGKIKYIRKIKMGQVPVSEKNGLQASIVELAKTDLLEGDGYIIGIVMSITDVHKNRAPISGKVVLSKYTSGKFLSLKKTEGIINNERNTTVIKGNITIGVVQIASRLVRRIVSYVHSEDVVKIGDRIGMIKFSSQTDLIIPASAKVTVSLGEQVYGGVTVVARYPQKK
jgi:phosphatidylserine decarboxylase